MEIQQEAMIRQAELALKKTGKWMRVFDRHANHVERGKLTNAIAKFPMMQERYAGVLRELDKRANQVRYVDTDMMDAETEAAVVQVQYNKAKNLRMLEYQAESVKKIVYKYASIIVNAMDRALAALEDEANDNRRQANDLRELEDLASASDELRASERHRLREQIRGVLRPRYNGAIPPPPGAGARAGAAPVDPGAAAPAAPAGAAAGGGAAVPSHGTGVKRAGGDLFQEYGSDDGESDDDMPSVYDGDVPTVSDAIFDEWQEFAAFREMMKRRAPGQASQSLDALWEEFQAFKLVQKRRTPQASPAQAFPAAQAAAAPAPAPAAAPDVEHVEPEHEPDRSRARRCSHCGSSSHIKTGCAWQKAGIPENVAHCQVHDGVNCRDYIASAMCQHCGFIGHVIGMCEWQKAGISSDIAKDQVTMDKSLAAYQAEVAAAAAGGSSPGSVGMSGLTIDE